MLSVVCAEYLLIHFWLKSCPDVEEDLFIQLESCSLALNDLSSLLHFCFLRIKMLYKLQLLDYQGVWVFFESHLGSIENAADTKTSRTLSRRVWSVFDSSSRSSDLCVIFCQTSLNPSQSGCKSGQIFKVLCHVWPLQYVMWRAEDVLITLNNSTKPKNCINTDTTQSTTDI